MIYGISFNHIRFLIGLSHSASRIADVIFHSLFITSGFSISWFKKHEKKAFAQQICRSCRPRQSTAVDSDSKCEANGGRSLLESRPHYATDNYESLITPHLERACENKTFEGCLPGALLFR